MERRTNLDVFGVLNSVLYDELFLESLGWQTERMDKFIQSSLIAEFAREVESRGKDGALFSSVKVEELAREYVLSLREAPPEGWLKYCFDVTESNLFPETKKRDESLDDRYGEGRLILLQILRGLYKYEDEVLPWDFIDVFVDKKFLLRERKKAYNAEVTGSCKTGCKGCGIQKVYRCDV